MSGWDAMGEDSLNAAKLLLDSGYARSSMSRAYYSAYCTLSGELARAGTTISAMDRPNPGHEQLMTLVANNLDPARFSAEQRRRMSRRFRNLLRLRVMADYDAENGVADTDALIAVREASAVRRDVWRRR